MATNINTALVEFMKNSVNFDPDETNMARAIRDWLIEQMRNFPVGERPSRC